MSEAAELPDAAGWPCCFKVFWNEKAWRRSSAVALRLLTTGIWYRGRRTGRVPPPCCCVQYRRVFLMFPCDLAWRPQPAGTPGRLAGTGLMCADQKDLSNPVPSSSPPLPPVPLHLFSVPVPDCNAPQVDDFKAHCKPKAMRRESEMCKTDRSEKRNFWPMIKVLRSFQSDVSVSTIECKICALRPPLWWMLWQWSPSVLLCLSIGLKTS